MADKKEKIGILGGSFDPIHLGHLGLARDVLKQLNLDAIWFIPAWLSPHKQDQTPADAAHRLHMLTQALAPFPKFQVSEIELDQKGVSYTIDTLTALQKRFPDREWFLILGMDAFRDFSSWKNVREILQSVHLTVATRPGYPDDPHNLPSLLDRLPLSYALGREQNGVQTCHCGESEKTISFCEIEPLDISSNEIREKIQRGQPVKKMLPPQVEGYIMTHRLYQANPQPQSE